ncbi:hypothetical protein [Streptomyces sp. NPDC049881]|uniref:hypothetical protein n=1 Tax=Streptomyces sp. NPDC049881 TaxID=3155778 RepID=UPI003440D4FA
MVEEEVVRDPLVGVVVAVNQPAGEAGLDAAVLVKRLLDGQGGGLSPDRIRAALAGLPELVTGP